MAHSAFYCHGVQMAWGLVRHRREKPRVNEFATGACFVKLTFKPEPFKGKLPRYPIVDGRGLVSVQAKHYGLEPHRMQFAELIAQLKIRVEQDSGLKLNGEVHLHTFPKLLGYVFNPVSFWYFHDEHSICRAILCEVNNTFGERHFYLLQGANSSGAPLDKGMALHATKEFHVSPFFPVSGRYEFRFVTKNQQTMARINYFEGDELKLTTSISGQMMHPSTRLWCSTFAKFGWFTLAVVAKIHWQAVKLLIKGATFHRKPSPPEHPISHTELKA